ncbi:Uncharacterized protein BM_BM10681 [Brugia malayi]|uniref:Bm10681 n=2 Tax=Brugia TaxID=6278 RepID=A0A0J9Y064_BRUMA|nr:Uncharacterized protein BM_BM10681 [Brugia malayi]CDP99057.1 Bm10681 [Brugia malayi]VIO91324.1 Uncharacterized protein BM_BM10681 [Brugia malayi]
MFTLSLIATLFATVTVDSLILYHPVYPNYVIPKHLQNFERNAPPRVFVRDPDMPSSGIVFLRKNSQQRLLNFPAVESNLHESNNRQKLHSGRSYFGQQKLEAINKPIIAANSKLSKNMPSRFYAIFDSKSKQFVTSSESRSSRWDENDDNEAASISMPYYEGTAQQISPEKGAKVALINSLTEKLRTRSSTSFGSDQRLKSVISRIPDTEISNRFNSGFKISVIDSDAVIKPRKL